MPFSEQRRSALLVPAVGAEIKPFSQQPVDMGGYSLIIGMKITAPGKWVRGGYRIDFVQDGVAYSNEVVAHITVCTPDAAEESGECTMQIPNDC